MIFRTTGAIVFWYLANAYFNLSKLPPEKRIVSTNSTAPFEVIGVITWATILVILYKIFV